jgi:hypothetical protein
VHPSRDTTHTDTCANATFTLKITAVFAEALEEHQKMMQLEPEN